MVRSRASAKQAGARFERIVADHAMTYLDNDAIDRRVKTGRNDKGDVAGLRSPHGERITVEVKDTAHMELGSWMRELEAEKMNDGTAIGIIVHKRYRFGEKNVGGNWVTMTYDDLLRLIRGPLEGTD